MVIYLDAANLEQIARYSLDICIDGFTTNPSLMKKAGITRYRDFAKEAIKFAINKPISLEVLADDFDEMERQAREIASWGENVMVKIPITDTRGVSSWPLISRIADLPLNITAVFTHQQIRGIKPFLREHHIVSVFAGRIKDTGRDAPNFAVKEDVCDWSFRVLWASAREIHDYYEALSKGYNIITLTPELYRKLDLHGRDLLDYSVETVTQFHKDGKGIEF